MTRIFFEKEKGALLDQALAGLEQGSSYGLCGGRGACGKCRVRFLSGAPLPSLADRKCFTPGELRAGYRLACTARPASDCEVELCFAEEPAAKILTVSGSGTDCFGADEADRKGSLFGCEQEAADGQFCAVDLGTTTVVMQLTDRRTGKVLYTYAFRNPQRVYGIDVLARISAAQSGRAEQMRRAVLEELETGLREMDAAGSPDEVVIAGNTTMEHLLLGYSVDTLGRAPFQPCHTGLSKFTLRGCPAVFLPGISAFVGADIVSGLYALGMAEREELTLLIDLGTNGEMAVGNRKGILCTATAAGSAFEGSVCSGVLGTDLTALAYAMLEEGIMDETGLLEEPWFTEGYRPGSAGDILIRQQDIRNLQMAKAAVCAGVSILLDRVDGWHRLAHVYLAGGFGYELDVAKAVGIGLVPETLQNLCTAVGNASLAGGIRWGRAGQRVGIPGQSPEREEVLSHIVSVCTSLNLAEQPEFEARYIDAMAFKRMGSLGLVP